MNFEKWLEAMKKGSFENYQTLDDIRKAAKEAFPSENLTLFGLSKQVGVTENTVLTWGKKRGNEIGKISADKLTFYYKLYKKLHP